MKSALFIALLILIVASKRWKGNSTNYGGNSTKNGGYGPRGREGSATRGRNWRNGGPKNCFDNYCVDQANACEKSCECSDLMNTCLSQVDKSKEPEEVIAIFQQCLSVDELAAALFDCVQTNCRQELMIKAM